MIDGGESGGKMWAANAPLSVGAVRGGQGSPQCENGVEGVRPVRSVNLVHLGLRKSFQTV